MIENNKNILIDDLEGEIWRDINGFPNYKCSNMGRVKTMPKEKVRLRAGNFITKEKILKQKITKWGYPSVTLYLDVKPVFKTVHRLILSSFEVNVSNKPQVNHKNGNKLDNRVTNLRWGTKSENYQDRFRHGTDNNGERNGRSVLNSLSVLAIRMRLTLGESQENLANEFGVSQVMISRIKLRKAWKHV